MINNLIAQLPIQGNYIAIWKLAVFTVLFGAWALVGQWLDKDAVVARTNKGFWNNIYLATGLGCIVAWFIFPAPFIVPLLMFIVVCTTVCVIYILHRNARMPDNERILTSEHIKFMFSGEGSKKAVVQRFVFISANGNGLPVPHRQDSEYEGFVISEELIYESHLRQVSRTEFIPVGEVTKVRHLIDGVLTDGGERPREEVDQAVAYIKAVAGLDVGDKRRPQSGDFTIEMEGKSSRWRIQTAGSTRGEQMLLERIEEAQTLVLTELGLNPDQLAAMEENINKKTGIVLIAGTSGNGVTTTLYSIMRKHDAFTSNINSLELTPLTDLDNITQHLLERGASPKDCARRFQSVLRSDPDVLMVGFCNSTEMVKIASKSGREKKLYFGISQPSTFHALRDWLASAERNDRVAETLQAITCQKLIRKLCAECREAYMPDPGILKKLNLPVGKIKQFYRPPTEYEYDKRGNPILCQNCQGVGYRGRTAVFETLFISDTLRQMIRDDAPLNALKTQCRKDKMLYLQEQAIRKVIDGTTSIQEVLRITTDDNSKKKPKKAKPPG